MKKILLLFSILFAVSAGYAAPKEASYGLCTKNIDGVGTYESGVWYEAAIEIPEAVAQAYKGATLSAIEFGFYSGLNKQVTVFVTYDLAEDPVYEEEVRAKVSKYNKVDLEKPFEIDGRRFYVGWKYLATTSQYAPVGFDGEVNAANPLFNNFAYWYDGSDKAAPNYYPQFGNLCINAYFSTEKDVELAFPATLLLPNVTRVDEEFEYSLNVRNFSTLPIESLTIETTFGDAEPIVRDVTLDSPIPVGEFGEIKLTGVCDYESLEVPVTTRILKLNGKENIISDMTCEVPLVCSDNVFTRINVVEEMTGVDCGWCPRGIVGLEDLKKNHPDDVIVIGVHNYNYPNDPMSCSSYLNWVVGSAPSATVNRDNVFDPNSLTLEQEYLAQRGIAFGGVDVKAVYSDEAKDAIDVSITTRFAQSYSVHSYALAIVRTQDNMGPFNQANNYAGGKYGSLEGWSDKGNSVSTIYNDVAREIIGFGGIDNSIPRPIVKGEDYEFDLKLKIDPYDAVMDVENSKITKLYADHPNTWIIALLIDRSTGKIVNAGRTRIEAAQLNPNDPKNTGYGVDAVDCDVVVAGGVGSISIFGEFDSAEIYGTDGSLRAVVAESDVITSSAGLYLVKVNVAGKSIVRKIMVK